MSMEPGWASLCPLEAETRLEGTRKSIRQRAAEEQKSYGPEWAEEVEGAEGAELHEGLWTVDGRVPLKPGSVLLDEVYAAAHEVPSAGHRSLKAT